MKSDHWWRLSLILTLLAQVACTFSASHIYGDSGPKPQSFSNAVRSLSR
jgi:hypothetical protein